MEHDEKMAIGEALHQQFIADEERATPEEKAIANRQAEAHISEYGHSYASALHSVLDD